MWDSMTSVRERLKRIEHGLVDYEVTRVGVCASEPKASVLGILCDLQEYCCAKNLHFWDLVREAHTLYMIGVLDEHEEKKR